MNLRRPLIIAGALTAGSAALGVWGVTTLPPTTTIAMNYGLDGQPHSHAPLVLGLWIFPFVSLVVTTVLAVAPRLRTPSPGLERSADAYALLITCLAALFLVAQGAFIMQAMDPAFDTLRWVFLAAAVLLVLVGNTLGKVRHNTVFGVRTRWTLADATVWDKTHRFTGRLMVAAALALAAMTMLAPNHSAIIAGMIIAASVPLVAGAIYSARIARRQA